MAVPRIGGSTPALPNNGIVSNSTVAGSPPFTTGFQSGFTNTISLNASEVFMIPAGTWMVTPGPYTFLQWLDPVTVGTGLLTGLWRTKPTAATRSDFIESDGSNWRLANLTGCAIGAVITSGGVGYPTNGIGSAVNGVTAAASSGASVWQTIVGGAVSLTIATATTTANTSNGAGYNFIPAVVIDAPPPGGMQATAYVTALAAGAVAIEGIVITNQGAGYATAPNITFVPDPREALATTPGPTRNAVAVLTLTATGQLTGLYTTQHGTTLTGVPTIAFAGTSASTSAATATTIMNFTVTAVGTGATGGSSLGSLIWTTASNIGVGTNFLTNPLHNGNQVTFPRPARISAGLTGGVASATTASIIEDAGLGIQLVPSVVPIYSISSTTAVVPQPGTAAVGGTADTSILQAM